MMPSQDETCELLAAWSSGDEAALEKLMPRVYDELRRKARHYLSAERPGHTLQATALIHEAYLKLAGQPSKPWQNRAHFLAVASQAMRYILVDYARSRSCAKRSAGLQQVTWDDGAMVSTESTAELLALDDALNNLAKIDPRKSRVVEMRYFGGSTVEEIAESLHLSRITVLRDWRLARAWLKRELSAPGTPEDGGT